MKHNALQFFNNQEEMIQLYTPIYQQKRGFLIESHIADIHFAAFDPSAQYQILEEQYLGYIRQLPRLDVVSVDGDLFDHKVMSNSEAARFATLFVGDLVKICREKNATLVLLAGTYQHDADQLKLFYHYMSDPTVDVRVVTGIGFENIKGSRILCIPELYGVDESIYQHFLFHSGIYDGVYMHGTIEGAIYGNNVGNGRLFTINDFEKCRGPIISGHVHKAGCFNGYFYYPGTPYRYKFGEEEEKGFYTVIRDLDSGYHYVQFHIINSFRYDTIDIDTLISKDPKVIIDYINRLQVSGVDHIKVRFHVPVEGPIRTVINNYYRNNQYTSVEFDDNSELRKEEELKSKNDEYGFLLDNSLTEEEKFIRFCNQKEGYEFITIDKLREILSDDF